MAMKGKEHFQGTVLGCKTWKMVCMCTPGYFYGAMFNSVIEAHLCSGSCLKFWASGHCDLLGILLTMVRCPSLAFPAGKRMLEGKKQKSICSCVHLLFQ